MDTSVVLKREKICPVSDAEYDGEDDGLLGFDDHADDTSYTGETTSTRKGAQYFRWTHTSIAILLKLRFEKDGEFANRQRPKKNLWNEISEGMKQFGGYIISGEHCDLKFRNMMQTYKKNRLKEERGKVDFINWEYYKYFKDAVGNSDRVPVILRESNTEDLDELSNADGGGEKNTFQCDVNETTTVRRSSKTPKTEEKNITRITNSSVEIRLPAKRKRFSKDLNKDSSPEEDERCIEATSSKVTPHNSSNENKCNCSQRTMSENECSDCKIFGESVGVQMANITSSCTRSLVKLKIQKILFLAETGKLDKCNKMESYCDSDS